MVMMVSYYHGDCGVIIPWRLLQSMWCLVDGVASWPAAIAIYYATLPLCDGACVGGVESWPAAIAIYYATLPLCDGACVDGVESWPAAIHWAGTTAIHSAVTTTKKSSWYTVHTRNPN